MGTYGDKVVNAFIAFTALIAVIVIVLGYSALELITEANTLHNIIGLGCITFIVIAIIIWIFNFQKFLKN